ncbi:Rv3654c family TadE-like protein [Plantibacter auratus]|uniref:Rv3654c family TadE-like protein n=1 Tax=Plantibacter auratus TaxID=272914 RepID=UPI003D345119
MSVRWRRLVLRAARDLRDETGAGSVLAAGILGALVAVLLATLPVVTLFAAHQRAANAADAAALAAADTASGRLPGFPCETARMVAARNAASLGTCSVEGVTVLVDATVDTAFGAITVAARAGPPPEASGAVIGVPATATY